VPELTADRTQEDSIAREGAAHRRRWPQLGLARRIILGVSLGTGIMVVIFGLIALETLNVAISAAGDEQVVVAEVVARQIAASMDTRSSTVSGSGTVANTPPRLNPGSVPPYLHVQVITTSGKVLEDTAQTSSTMVANHVALLHPLIASVEGGYRVHRPGPGDTFEPHVVAYAPVPGHPTLGVIIQQSQAIALDAPDELIQRLIIAGAFALIAAIAAAWIDVHRVVRPLRTLTAAAERFAVGQFDKPVVVERSDELGVLASSFESMRQRLSQSLDEIAKWNQELEKHVEERTRELERRNRQLAAINTIAEPLSGSLDTNGILERTLERVCEVTGFDVASYRLMTPERTLSLAVGHHLTTPLDAEVIPVGRCLCGLAAEHSRCQFASPLSRELGAEACLRAGVMSAVAVPLLSAEQVEGILFLGAHEERRFETGDLDTLSAIGRQIGMALANARLYDALRRRERERAQLLGQVIAAQEEERRRLANGLHDEVSQALTSILLGIESIAGTNQLGLPARRAMEDLRGLITTTIGNVHTIAAELRPSLLDDIGLVAALTRLVDDIRTHNNLAVDFQTVNVEHLHLSAPAETTLFRIAEAALSNVAYHAAAKTVSILLQRRGDRLLLVVEDDGRGFDVDAVRARPLKDRLGLAGIEERAQLIGARTTIESQPGLGTTIFVDLPVIENLAPEAANA
jgi:signal transduction histidine kinase/HAMP domain-containing protein